MNIWDLTAISNVQEWFWHNQFYVELYIACLVCLILFKKQMTSGKRFFFHYSIVCLVLFVYNPIFVNLIHEYLLYSNQVLVRIFLLLPILFTEAYVFASVTSVVQKKSRILSVSFTCAIVALLLFFGITPWQRVEKGGWQTDMYLLAENPYKIPQEHLEICNAILNDMDGNRAVLSMYELHGINDIGGTLNYSIRMYTSRIQLEEVMDLDSYLSLSFKDRMLYWDSYIASIQSYETDSSTIYFLFPKDDERAADLYQLGCCELPTESQDYQVLMYTQ